MYWMTARQADTSDFSGQIGMDERQRLLAEIIDLEERRAKLARQQGHMFLEAAQKHIANDFCRTLIASAPWRFSRYLS